MRVNPTTSIESPIMFVRGHHAPFLIAMTIFASLILGRPGAAVAEDDTTAESMTLEEAIVVFGEEFVWSETIVGHNRTESRYFQGLLRQEVHLPELYDVLGEQEAYDAYNRRSRRAKRLMIISTLTAFVFTGASLHYYDPDRRVVDDRVHEFAILAGAATVPLGIGAYLYFHRDPLTHSERTDLIDEYNSQLLDELELELRQLPREDFDDFLPDEMPRQPQERDERRPGTDSLYVNGYFNDDGGGVAVGFTF